jgi:hypothetical protein
VEDDYRCYYASYACRAGQEQVFLDQIKIIRETGAEMNYQLWGGRDGFDQAMEHARQALTEKIPPPGQSEPAAK